MAMSKIKQVIYVKLIYINKNVYVYTYIWIDTKFEDFFITC
jgi:hypothetical protein